MGFSVTIDPGVPAFSAEAAAASAADGVDLIFSGVPASVKKTYKKAFQKERRELLVSGKSQLHISCMEHASNHTCYGY